MENQSLLKSVEELQSAVGSVEGSNSKILKMEKENQRLSKKVPVIIYVVMNYMCSYPREDLLTTQSFYPCTT